MKPADFIFLFGLAGAICTAFALFYTWRQNINSSNRAIQTLANTDSLLHENRLLKEQAENQSNKIDSLRSENNELSSKLMDKSLDIYKNITGDGNKPVLIISPSNLEVFPNNEKPSCFMVQFIVKNSSKYPLRNVIIKITDFTGREMIQYGVRYSVSGMTMMTGVRDRELELKNYDPNPTFEIGTIPPKVERLVYRTTYSPELSPIEPHYNVEIIWDNGHLIHLVSLKNKENKLVFDHRQALFNGQLLEDETCFKFGID